MNVPRPRIDGSPDITVDGIDDFDAVAAAEAEVRSAFLRADVDEPCTIALVAGRHGRTWKVGMLMRGRARLSFVVRLDSGESLGDAVFKAAGSFASAREQAEILRPRPDVLPMASDERTRDLRDVRVVVRQPGRE